MGDVPSGVLPPEAAGAWPVVAAALPAGAYLVGGTALAVRLGHRVSRDLDVFVPAAFDTDLVRRLLERDAPVVVTAQDIDATLNVLVDGARVQFLAAIGQTNLDEPDVYDGIPVAGYRDLLAMKLKVIGDRGELRDYFDVMEIERRTPHSMEQGLAYYMTRYGVGPHDTTLTHIVRALGAFDDVADDPAIPHRSEIEGFFTARHPEVIRSLGSADLTHGQQEVPADAVPLPPPSFLGAHPRQRCTATTRSGRRCSFRALPGSPYCGKHVRRR